MRRLRPKRPLAIHSPLPFEDWSNSFRRNPTSPTNRAQLFLGMRISAHKTWKSPSRERERDGRSALVTRPRRWADRRSQSNKKPRDIRGFLFSLNHVIKRLALHRLGNVSRFLRRRRSHVARQRRTCGCRSGERFHGSILGWQPGNSRADSQTIRRIWIAGEAEAG